MRKNSNLDFLEQFVPSHSRHTIVCYDQIHFQALKQSIKIKNSYMQQLKTELFDNLILFTHIKTNRGGFLFVQAKELQGSSSTIHSCHCTFIQFSL
jgi:hypothetical protein